MAMVCEASHATRAGTREESTGIERRVADRYRTNWYPAVHFLSRSATLQSHRGLVRDVSRAGLGLVVERALEPGAILAIQLRSSEAGFSGILSAEVRHVTPQADGTCIVGCSLSRKLTDSEMTSLL